MTDAHLAARLRELREAAGFTREQLSAASGVSAEAVESIETGRTRSPRVGTFMALAKALGVTSEQLASPPESPAREPRRGMPPKSAE